MHICHVEVGNFRKLQAVRIDFSETATIFVGANNSGKTSAMVALRRFLVDRSDLSIHDFTLSHWHTLDAVAGEWESQTPDGEPAQIDWDSVLPFVDVWLQVHETELHYVQKLLPTLDWNGAPIGVRIRYEPRDPAELRRDYLSEKAAAAEVMAAAATAKAAAADQPNGENEFALWPKTMMDFLSRRLRSCFEMKAYILDPDKLVAPQDGLAKPQKMSVSNEPIDGDPFKGLIRIDEISAQRGFGFGSRSRATGDEVSDESGMRDASRLSGQLRSYYAQHLDPFDKPEVKDLEALQALHEAQAAFGRRLEAGFSAALKELETIGYPGVTDPKLTITTKIKPIDGLNHASAVQYEVPTHLGASSEAHRLPEESNGLGYQNLVSIVFKLMSYRDKWMKVGKAARTDPASEALIPPLHLVLVEEPEAHLHAQVQQVFINQAYAVLRNHELLKTSTSLRTQLVVSTHSSHVAHEADFASLRYFRRQPAPPTVGAVPISSVVNLSEVFGKGDKTERFVRRYLKASHCDLFFADAAVLVEGPAERILVPHFVRERDSYEMLRQSYITWLEIGGSHSHRLKSLLEHLGLVSLIITDLDAKNTDGSKAVPALGAGLESRNETLRTWIPGETSLDKLIALDGAAMQTVTSGGAAIRVAYQLPTEVKYKSDSVQKVLANTFEDALLYANMSLFGALSGVGLIAKFRDALSDSVDAQTLTTTVSDALGNGDKARLALDLLMCDESDQIEIPKYIHEGLTWLGQQLTRKEVEAKAATGEGK